MFKIFSLSCFILDVRCVLYLCLLLLSVSFKLLYLDSPIVSFPLIEPNYLCVIAKADGQIQIRIG